MDTKLLDISIVELGRTKRRFDKLIHKEKEHLSFLERSSDDCWTYPNANANYESYLDGMEKSQDRLNKLNDIKDNIESILEQIKSLN